jgi:competence protein ComEA
MNSLKRLLSEWLGYSRRERRASMILVVIIATVIVARYFIPEKGLDIEVSAVLPPSPSIVNSPERINEVDSSILFSFDPNTATYGELTSLGIPVNVARTLIRYRTSGGIFRQPGDIRKIYGMDSAFAEKIIPYITIEQYDMKKGVIPEKAIVYAEKDRKASDLTDINKSDSADLVSLPGIGKVLSARIIKYRELLGGFVSVSQLKEVYGISDSVYNIISGMIIIDSTAIRRIKINSAGFRELDRHPYLERYDAQAIIKFREINGKINNISEMTLNRILTKEKALRLAPYFSY